MASEEGVFYAILVVERCTEVKLVVGASQAPPPLVSETNPARSNENFHLGHLQGLFRCPLQCLFRCLLWALPVAAPTSRLVA